MKIASTDIVRMVQAGVMAILMTYATPGAADAPLTNDDIVKLVQARLPASTVVKTIRATGGQFDTSPEALIRLSKSGIPQEVIEAMIDNKGGASAAESNGDAVTPEEITVTADGNRTKMRYVIARSRSAARALGLGGVATYAVLVGPRAQLRLTDTNPTFEIAVPENAQPESYLTLANFAVRRNNNREVMIGGGYISYSTGITADRIVETRGERLADQSRAPKGYIMYSVAVIQPLKPGEYALVTYNSEVKVTGWFASGSDSYFDFGVD